MSTQMMNKKAEDDPFPDRREETKKADRRSRRYHLIRLCIFLSGLSVFAQLYLFQPLLPAVSRTFGVSLGDSSFLVSSSTLGMATGLFYFAFNADKYGRKMLMVFALMMSACLTILSAWVEDIVILVLIGFFKGVAISGVSAVALAYLVEEITPSLVAASVGFYLAGNIVGGMSGRILGAVLAGEFGWQNAVLIIGLESLVLGLLFWKFFPESRFFRSRAVRFGRKLHRMGGMLRDKVLIQLYLIAALLMGVFVSVYNYLSFRLENRPFELNHVVVGFIFVMYIFGVVGTMMVSRITKLLGILPSLRISVIVMFFGCLLLSSRSLFLLIAGLALFTTAFFAVHTMASRVVAVHAVRDKSTATSLYWLFYYVGSSIVGSSTGYLLHDQPWLVFIAVLSALVAIAYYLSLRVRLA